MPDDQPLAFEAGLQQLEAIVKEMESGDLPLERALDLFERGTKLSDASAANNWPTPKRASKF